MSLLPSFMQAAAEAALADEAVMETVELPYPKEYEMDFETGMLTGHVVSGIEAIKVWIWCALHTQRFRYAIYSWDYGADVEQYFGQAVTDEFLNTDYHDEVEETLTISPYITGIDNFSAYMDGSVLHAEFLVRTIYGDTEVSINV